MPIFTWYDLADKWSVSSGLYHCSGLMSPVHMSGVFIERGDTPRQGTWAAAADPGQTGGIFQTVHHPADTGDRRDCVGSVLFYA